jgi:predicted metal-dependent phosphoesterase TrpH
MAVSLRVVRRLAACAVVAGVAAAGRVAEPPPAVRMMAGGYTVLAADFHVHGFPDGIPPWDEAREARRRRLDAIALTSHNSRVGWWLWTHGPRVRPDVIVLPGEELTSVGYHLALVGVSQPVWWHQSMQQAAADAHAYGGVAILAHPSGDALKRILSDEGLRALDGVERAHPAMEGRDDTRRDFQEIFRRAIAVKPGMSAVGSSDFHFLGPIGLCRTYVFVRETTAAAVIDALRDGRTVACDARGQTYGPAELRRFVDDRCRRDATNTPEGDTRLARLGTALAWLGLVVLVLAGTAA